MAPDQDPGKQSASTAKRRRLQQQRDQSRRVQWLVGVFQSVHSHHTSPTVGVSAQATRPTSPTTTTRLSMSTFSEADIRYLSLRLSRLEATVDRMVKMFVSEKLSGKESNKETTETSGCPPGQPAEGLGCTARSPAGGAGRPNPLPTGSLPDDQKHKKYEAADEKDSTVVVTKSAQGSGRHYSGNEGFEDFGRVAAETAGPHQGCADAHPAVVASLSVTPLLSDVQSAESVLQATDKADAVQQGTVPAGIPEDWAGGMSEEEVQSFLKARPADLKSLEPVQFDWICRQVSHFSAWHASEVRRLRRSLGHPG